MIGWPPMPGVTLLLLLLLLLLIALLLPIIHTIQCLINTLWAFALIVVSATNEATGNGSTFAFAFTLAFTGAAARPVPHGLRRPAALAFPDDPAPFSGRGALILGALHQGDDTRGQRLREVLGSHPLAATCGDALTGAALERVDVPNSSRRSGSVTSCSPA